MKTTPLCYCKIPMFLDGDTWLCPARFDGLHKSERESEHVAKQAELSTLRAATGALGGQARAERLSALETRRIAQQAARARWTASRKVSQRLPKDVP